MNDPRTDLKDALAELARRKKAEEIPDRHLVRLSLLSLGRLLIDGAEEEAAEPARELMALVEAHGDHWVEAFNSEMALAVAEHVHGVDPHYLDLPSYDFDYTVAARERLEARLRAADALHLPVAEALLEQVAAADERLAPYLNREA